MKCAKCGEPIERPRDSWPEYRGYARPRNQRGDQSGSSLIDRKPTGAALCAKCGHELDMGIDGNQQALV